MGGGLGLGRGAGLGRGGGEGVGDGCGAGAGELLCGEVVVDFAEVSVVCLGTARPGGAARDSSAGMYKTGGAPEGDARAKRACCSVSDLPISAPPRRPRPRPKQTIAIRAR